MTDGPTSRQQILLWTLVSRGGSAMQKEMKPDVEAADRNALERRGYLSTTKGKNNANRLTLEERGWDHLATAAPTLLASGKGSSYDRPILQFVLERVQAYAAANDVSFARVFVPAAADAGQEDVVGGGDPREGAGDGVATRGAAAREAADGDGLDDRVVAAFFAIAGRPPLNHVRLKALRARLDGASRSDVDRTLAAMRASGRIALSTLSNPADVAKEGDAPLTIDGGTFHTLWIDS